jgi:AhpD family alkylhydroperoxidase
MRIDYTRVAPEATKPLYALSREIEKGPLGSHLRELLSVQVSQINRCAHCIEVHWKEALEAGVPEAKLRLLPAFREAGVYEEEEMIALELAEAVTLLSRDGVPDALWRRVEQAFSSEDARMHLLYQIILMNSWNRVSVTLKLEPPK